MNWWQRFWKRERLEKELDRELRFHLEERVERLKAGGLGAAEARRSAT